VAQTDVSCPAVAANSAVQARRSKPIEAFQSLCQLWSPINKKIFPKKKVTVSVYKEQALCVRCQVLDTTEGMQKNFSSSEAVLEPGLTTFAKSL
jgi:hypothetical protein